MSGQGRQDRTPGQEALREAARLEAALVYGSVVPEYQSDMPASVFAAAAEAELEAALLRAKRHGPPLEPVHDDPEPVHDIIAAIHAGLTTSEIIERFCVDYATVRAARRAAA